MGTDKNLNDIKLILNLIDKNIDKIVALRNSHEIFINDISEFSSQDYSCNRFRLNPTIDEERNKILSPLGKRLEGWIAIVTANEDSLVRRKYGSEQCTTLEILIDAIENMECAVRSLTFNRS